MAYDGEGDGDGGGDDSPTAQIVMHTDGCDFPHAIIVFNGAEVSMLLPPSRESREIIANIFEAAAKDVRATICVDDVNQLTLKDVLNQRFGKESRKDETKKTL